MSAYGNALYLNGVPNEWDCVPLKRCFHISKRIAGELGYDVLSITQRGLKVRDITDFKGQLSSDYSKYQIVEPGDFAMNHMDLLTGWIDCSKQLGVTSPDYRVFKVDRNDFDKRYFLYFFQSCYNLRIFYGFGRGISGMGRWRLPADQFNNMMIPVPAPATQTEIADYLDAKCAEIDKAIEAAEASIEEYKLYKKSVIFQAVTKGLNPDAPMKDSGIEWIGEMPASWRSCRGKDVLNHLSRKTEEGDGIVTCFRDGEVTLRSNRREEGFTVAEKEFGYQGIEPGDLVVHGMDGFAGSIGVSDSRGKGSPVLNVLDSDENKRFLMYYLRGLAYRDVYMAMSTGIRVRSCNLNWKKLSELSFEIPERTEQDKIAAFLDMKCAEIDRAIEAKQIIIEELKSYKKSLIWETVTGKREVSCL